MAQRELSSYYDEILTYGADVQLSANYCLNEVLGLRDDQFSEWIKPEHFAEMIKLLSDKTISSKQAKVMMEELPKGKDPQNIMKEKNMIQISDESVLISWIEGVLKDNPQVIDDYKAGKDNSLKFVMGQVMKLSKGQA